MCDLSHSRAGVWSRILTELLKPEFLVAIHDQWEKVVRPIDICASDASSSQVDCILERLKLGLDKMKELPCCIDISQHATEEFIPCYGWVSSLISQETQAGLLQLIYMERNTWWHIRFLGELLKHLSCSGSIQHNPRPTQVQDAFWDWAGRRLQKIAVLCSILVSMTELPSSFQGGQ